VTRSAPPSASGFAVGDAFEGELVFYPSAVPLRALLVRQTTGAQPGGTFAMPEAGLEAAYRLYEAALAARPWLDDYPLAFCGAEVRRSAGRVYVCGEGLALPLAEAQEAAAWPLLRAGGIAAAGLWDGVSFTLCWAETALGWWVA
jgi:hypothetical protein